MAGPNTAWYATTECNRRDLTETY